MKRMMCLVVGIATLAGVAPSHSGAEERAKESWDCALMTGATVSVAALGLSDSGYGDIKYWIRTFELRRDNANAVAGRAERSLLPAIRSKLLRSAVAEVMKDIYAVKQDGYGNINYWTEACAEQSRAYSRAASKLEKLKNASCSD